MKILKSRVLIEFIKENFRSPRFHSCTNKQYRVLFFGSDDVALKGLQKVNELYKNGNLITKLELVTANRSQNLSVIEKYAVSQNLNILPWPVKDLKYHEYDIGVVVSFGHLIPEQTIAKFPLGMVNVHTSLLPRWRGAAPVVHTLLHGDKETGVTLMSIKPHQFDIGEVILQESFDVPTDITLPTLTMKLAELGSEMLVKCLHSLPRCLFEAKPQNEEGVTYAKKIDKSISIVRWSEMDAAEVYNLSRAIHGIYQLKTLFRSKEIKLLEPFLDPTNSEQISTKLIGSVEYSKQLDAVRVLCKDKRFICFRRLRIVGKREITAFDFYNGYLKKTSLEDSIFY